MMDYDSLHYFPNNLPQPKTDFVVFIDRDGVIWEEQKVGVPFKEYLLVKGSAEAIAKLNQENIFTVVVNNQARVARGEITDLEAQESNHILEEKLKEKNSFIDLYLYCPHSKFADVKDFKLDCPWRKPGAGMLEFVGKNLPIDLKKSFMVGDQARDFLSAKLVGATSIGVKTGKAGKDEVFTAEPKIWRQDLFKAVEHILSTTGQ